ncbi:hypothetical protein C5167_045274 [Papaver somniferum]|uniref:Uncharacterized protein n=1 Tax=Papaver somniferum TaxID=3469 RepID=A0A4Y7LBV2_PAPSO|nr:hypothetical protein C5167_045274 [Papaver somniferum]
MRKISLLWKSCFDNLTIIKKRWSFNGPTGNDQLTPPWCSYAAHIFNGTRNEYVSGVHLHISFLDFLPSQIDDQRRGKRREAKGYVLIPAQVP